MISGDFIGKGSFGEIYKGMSYSSPPSSPFNTASYFSEFHHQRKNKMENMIIRQTFLILLIVIIIY